ncbi:MAG TPA: serine protease [bacterium]
MDVRLLPRLPLLLCACVVLAAPASAGPSAAELIRQQLWQAAVRIEIDLPTTRARCTGWIGYTEPGRSAAYTAAHCYREGAQYRVTLENGDLVAASNLTRWPGIDLMALWIPRGNLRALRAWKPLPDGPFRALYVLSKMGGPLILTEALVQRVYREIRFDDHPTAVAVPAYSQPGTSGAPIVDLADGMLIGMVIGYASERPEVAAVIPAERIYETLAKP